ncbi:hypothetical protein DFH06DRAFT_1122032 [Mycena polygramma]|nr:hypothetical protein DFH06DRAFT_1122032 [Mycena polygramma]
MPHHRTEQNVEPKPTDDGGPNKLVVSDDDDMPELEDCEDDDDEPVLAPATIGSDVVLYKSPPASNSDVVLCYAHFSVSSKGFVLPLVMCMDANFRLRRGERYAHMDFKPASTFHKTSHYATCAYDLRYLRSDPERGEYFVDGEGVERPWTWWVGGQTDGEPIERAWALSTLRKAPMAIQCESSLVREESLYWGVTGDVGSAESFLYARGKSLAEQSAKVSDGSRGLTELLDDKRGVVGAKHRAFPRSHRVNSLVLQRYAVGGRIFARAAESSCATQIHVLKCARGSPTEPQNLWKLCMDDTLPIDVEMHDAPGRPGSRFNLFLLPESPPKPAKAKRIMRQIQRRVNELEAQRARILTPLANNLPAAASTTAPAPAPAESSRAPRPRGPMLALEASYRENRTAARNQGPAAQIPRGGFPTEASGRALRREEALRLQMSPHLRAIVGFRRLRVEPLTYQDLWIGGQGPPEQDAIEGYQKCTICHFAKSHPVSMWLERKWTCPDCVRPMFVAPFRQYAEEAALARAFPNWIDTSVVDYSFDSLIFPQERVPYPELD